MDMEPPLFSLPSLSVEETDRQTDATGGGAGGWKEGVTPLPQFHGVKGNSL